MVSITYFTNYFKGKIWFIGNYHFYWGIWVGNWNFFLAFRQKFFG